MFDVSADVRQSLSSFFGNRVRQSELPNAAAMRAAVADASARSHAAGLIGPGGRFSVIEIADPASATTVGTFQPFIDDLLAKGGAGDIDRGSPGRAGGHASRCSCRG